MLSMDLPVDAPIERLAPDFAPHVRSKKLHFQALCIDYESEQLQCEIKAAHTSRQQFVFACSGQKYYLDGYVSIHKLRVDVGGETYRNKLEDYEQWLTDEHVLSMQQESIVQQSTNVDQSLLDSSDDDDDEDDDSYAETSNESSAEQAVVEDSARCRLRTNRRVTERLIDHMDDNEQCVGGDEAVGFSDEDVEDDVHLSETSEDRAAIVDDVSEVSNYSFDEDLASFTSSDTDGEEQVADINEQHSTVDENAVPSPVLRSPSPIQMSQFYRRLYDIYGMPVDQVKNLPPNLKKLLSKIRGKHAPSTPVGYAIEYRECSSIEESPDLFKEGVSRSATSHGYCDSCAATLRARQYQIPAYIQHRMAGTEIRAEDVRRTGIIVKEVSSCDFKKSLDQGVLKEWYERQITSMGEARLGASTTEKEILNAVRTGKLRGFIQLSLYCPLEKRQQLEGIPPVLRHATITRDDLCPLMRTQAEENNDMRTPRRLLVSAYEAENGLYTCDMVKYLMSLDIFAYNVLAVYEYKMESVFAQIINKMVDMRMGCKRKGDALGDVYWKLKMNSVRFTD